MSTKTNEEMLKTIKQYNKTTREIKAKKEGFATSIIMISYLQGFISSGLGKETYFPLTGKVVQDNTPQSPGPGKTKKASKVIPVIHVIDILDASGSMAGSKYNAAVKGINMGVTLLKKDTAEVSYTYTLCDFSSDVIFRHITQPLSKVGNFRGNTRGATALYDAIGDSINAIRHILKGDYKVLVNIYTDGQENSSRRFNAKQISSLIEDLSKVGWTFTFIGQQDDVDYAQKNLKFDKSNTLVHDNTGAGLEKAFVTNSVARSAYSSKVSAGEDVSKGFYKDIQ